MPDSCGYPAPDPLETYIDGDGIARVRANCNTSPEPEMIGATVTSGQGPAGHQGASVGRIIHYYRQAATVPIAEREPLAGIITRVHGVGGMVELEVFGLPEKTVYRTVPFHPCPRSGCWTWPPRS